MSQILTVTLNPTVDIYSETDVVQPIRKNRTKGIRYEPGGGGINVSRVIAELGGSASTLFTAGGEIGEFLKRLLAEEGIHGQPVAIAGQTRIAVMVQEQSTGLEYRFVPDGPRMTTDELLPCLAAVAEHRGEFVVVSGSLPPGAPEDIYARLAEATTRRGAKFVLDSSGPGLSKTLETSHVHLMKPSRSEIEKLVGRRLDDESLTVAAMNIVEKGLAKMVAVTLGADGALLASENGVVRVPAIHVRVRSAVGAGDSFLGAMTWALSEGQTPEKAFRLGLAAGAAAVMMPGSKLCRKQDVLSLFERTSRETQ